MLPKFLASRLAALVPATTETAEADAPPPSLGSRLRQPRTLISFAIGFGVLLLTYQRLNVDLPSTLATLRQVNPWLYLLAFFVFYDGFVMRGLRWQRLLRNVGYDEGTTARLPSLWGLERIVLISWSANCLVPARLGDAYRGYLLKRAANVSFSKTFGTIVAERILDLIGLFALLGVSAVLAFGAALPDSVLGIVELALLLAVVLIGGVVAMRVWGRHFGRLLPDQLQAKYRLFHDGTMRSFQGLPVLGVYTVTIWLTEAARLYLVMLALGLTDIHPTVPVFIALASALLTAVPLTPAGLGFVETGLVGLVLLSGELDLINGVTREIAFSVALLDRGISYWSLIVVGGVLHLRGGNR